LEVRRNVGIFEHNEAVIDAYNETIASARKSGTTGLPGASQTYSEIAVAAIRGNLNFGVLIVRPRNASVKRKPRFRRGVTNALIVQNFKIGVEGTTEDRPVPAVRKRIFVRALKRVSGQLCEYHVIFLCCGAAIESSKT
jgi:hypothetical protein